MPSTVGSAARGTTAVVALLLSGAPLAAQQQRQEFRASVETVRVGAVAFDGDGAFVDDLTADEFIVLEDGKPQEIVGLRLEDVGAGRVLEAGSAGTAEAQPGGDGIESADTAARTPSELGAVIYLVDGLGLGTRNQVRFSMRWAAELAARPGLDVPHALYRIDRMGQSHEIVALTEDIEALRAGVVELEALAEANRLVRMRIREPSLQRFALLEQFCDALAGRSGRTVLVYVSTGISLMRRGMPDTRVLAAQEEMHAAANAGNVSLYSIDPSLMYELIGTGVDMSKTEGTAVRSRAGSARDAIGNSLRHAAAATGGRAFIGWSELDRVIEHIEQDTSRYYLLTYVPQRTTNDGTYHELDVQVTRPGVLVRARRGYTDDPPEVREERRISGALALPGATGSIPIAVEAVADDPAAPSTYTIHVGIGREDLRTELRADGTAVVRAEFHIGAATGQGETTFYRATPIVREVDPHPDGEVVAAAGDMLTHSEVIDLEPGDYELKIVVLDQVGDRIGARSMALSVPSRD